jgi:hypothetical protein
LIKAGQHAPFKGEFVAQPEGAMVLTKCAILIEMVATTTKG